jgi:hypothetical protein
MLNRKLVIVNDESEVKSSLHALVGLTPEIVQNVATAVSVARSNSLAVDPCNSPGIQAYIYGVRNIRLQLLPLGWRMSRVGNIESTVNDELGIQLCFQNVDQACRDRDPEAISEKGSGSRKLIYNGRQSELFKNVSKIVPEKYGSTPTVWVICVSVDEKNNVCAEVSCPKVFDGKRYNGFSKRIFVVDDLSAPKSKYDKKSDINDDSEDFEVRVSKK